jgi:hypothetical protein
VDRRRFSGDGTEGVSLATLTPSAFASLGTSPASGGG